VKKLIIAVSLVIILIFSAVGTAVMAAPPPDKPPVETWDLILARIGSVITWDTIADGIEAIYEDLTAVQEDIEIISANLTAVQEGIEIISANLTDIKEGMIIMESGSGEVALPGSGDSVTEFGDIDGPIQHVSLTIARCCSGGWDSLDQIRIQANWPETENETRIVKTYSIASGDTLDFVDTLEFNASKWAIITNHTTPPGGEGWRIDYAYTSTYVAD